MRLNFLIVERVGDAYTVLRQLETAEHHTAGRDYAAHERLIEQFNDLSYVDPSERDSVRVGPQTVFPRLLDAPLRAVAQVPDSLEHPRGLFPREDSTWDSWSAPLTYVTAGELAQINPGDNETNRKTFAAIACMPADTMLVLYW